MIVMISATGFHLVRSEFSSAAVTCLLLLISAYVAYMRWRVYPIGERKTLA